MNNKRLSVFIIVLALAICVSNNSFAAGELTMANDYMSMEKWGQEAAAPVYKAQQKAYYHTYVAGLQAKSDGKYSISGNLLVIGPDGKIHRWAPDLIVEENIDKSIFQNDLLPISMSLEMLPSDLEGEYTFVIQIDDKISGKKGSVSKKYTYKK
ncbi:MAG: hypothetical protein ABII18_11625 [bacterium]|nr:hypothetical protein [bacterium]MBU1917038.1 hypothetical protein [bacterium]